MNLSLTPMPGTVGAFTLLPNTDPSSGVVTFTARPTRHAWAVSQTILGALGARDDVFGAGRRHDQDLMVLHAWLHAYDTKVLVVRHANHLRNRTLMDNLLHIAASVGAHLALTCDENVTDLVDWVEQHGGTVHTDHEPLLRLVAETARPFRAVGEAADTGFPQYLPRIDFYGYRARCRDILTPAQFDLVDRLYTDTFRSVRADPYATAEEASARLAATIADHRTPGEALTVARAAQAAMFTHALLLKVNVSTLLNGVRDAEHRRLTPAEVRALRAYRTPWRSSAVILRDADLSPDDIHTLTIGQVSGDGNITGVPHILPLHQDARVYLKAQRRYRLDLGAEPNDLLIDNTRAHVKRAFRLAGSELNLPTSGAHERCNDRKSNRWQRTIGVTLLPLVTAHLPSPADIKKAA